MNTKPLGELMTEYETELVKKYKYEIELNLNEQRMALMTLVDMLGTSMRGIERKRNMRLSEKAMAKASFATKIVALKMAVDEIDARLKAQADYGNPMS